MPLEQNNFKFNKENFKNNFKLALEKYVSALDDLEHSSYEGNEEETAIEKRRLNSEIEKLTNGLVSLSANALNLAENKQEILNMISETFFDLYDSTESQYWGEKEYFKKMILELLKTTAQK
jgi:hypothetical protein